MPFSDLHGTSDHVLTANQQGGNTSVDTEGSASQTISGLRYEVESLRATIHQLTADFTTLVQQNTQQNSLILQMRQELNEIRNAVLRELGPGFESAVNSTNAQIQGISPTTNSNYGHQNASHSPLAGTNNAAESPNDDGRPLSQRKGSESTDAGGRRRKRPCPPHPRDSGYESMPSRSL